MIPPSPIRAVREPSDPRSAFTLMEVLVATAVMAILVLMLGGVFQQASSSWDSGYARGEEGMAVRAAIGSLTRDLATAVDGRRYGLSAPIEPGPGQSSGTLTFWRLRDGPSGSGKSDVEKVVYSGGTSVTRNGSSIYSPGSSGGQGARFEFYVGGETEESQNSGDYRPYENQYLDESTGAMANSSFPSKVAWTIPYVKVRCTLTRKGNIAGLWVRSTGRDGKEGGGDDIVVR